MRGFLLFHFEDFDLGEMLAMSLLFIVAVLGVEFEDDFLAVPAIFQNLGFNLGSGNVGLSDFDSGLDFAKQNLVKNYAGTLIQIQLLDL